MTVSSRTPEGSYQRCPLCGKDVIVEPSHPAGEAPCPHCGQLLWFSRTPLGIECFKIEDVAEFRTRVLDILCEHLSLTREQLGSSKSFREEIGADSLDVVELIMDLEAEFGVQIPEHHADEIDTIGDLIDYFIRKFFGKGPPFGFS